MLKIIKSMFQLNTKQLLVVYLQSNMEYGKCHYPDKNEETQLQGAEDEFLTYLREDFFRQKGAFYAVWVCDGAYQAALRLEPYRDGLLLEALETAPNARRKGCAYELICETLSYLRESAYKCVYSHIDKRNSASLGVHSKCGFQRISESATYIDGTVTVNSCTMCYYL